MSERSAAPAEPVADSPDSSGSAPNSNDDSPTATADLAASASPVEVPDSEAPVVGSQRTCGNDRDADDAAGSRGGAETASDTASAVGGQAMSEHATDSDATAVE